MGHRSEPPRTTGTGPDRNWPVVLAGGFVALAAASWFLMSWRVMGTAAGDAAGESVGVAFGLLIVVSVIGAVAGRRHTR